jgi:hypothetical protein
MSLWDSLTNVFSTDAADKAAEQQRAYLSQVTGQVNANLGTAKTEGLGALQSGLTGGVGAIQGGTGTGRADITGAVDPSIAALLGGTGAGAGALTDAQRQALASLTGGVGAAAGAYAPVMAGADKYGDAATLARTMHENALGLHGTAGVDTARQTFKADPGNEFAINTGVDALTRASNASGGGNFNANVLREAQQFGQGTADQNYQRWLSQLGGQESLYSPLEASGRAGAASGIATADLTGATGGANIYTGTGKSLADLYSGTGTNIANIYGGAGKSLADLASKGGLAEGALYGDTGGKSAGLIGDLAKTSAGAMTGLADDYSKTYGDQAAAAYGASKNLWSGIGGIAKLGANLYTGGLFSAATGA